MIRIRNDQLEAIVEAGRSSPEEQLLARLCSAFPEQSDVVGEDQVRAVVWLGQERAAEYRITSEDDLYAYCSMMFMLGSRFDVAPEYPWASEILTDSAAADPSQRLATLTQRATEYLVQAVGPEGEHLERVVRQLLGQPTSKWIPSLDGDDFERCALERLAELYPEKTAAIGEDAAITMIRHATAAALAYGIAERRPLGAYIGVAFFLGSGFDRDPLFPWAGAILQSHSEGEEDTRSSRLLEAAKQHLEQWWAASQDGGK